MKRIDFIIFYEHVSREFSSVKKLKVSLEALGLQGVIFPKHFYKYLSVIKFRPSIVILPYLYSRKNDQHLMFESVYGRTPVLNLHSEQLHDETTKKFQMPHDDYAKNCYHISWGNRFANALIESGVKKELVYKTGSIRNDDTFLKYQGKEITKKILIPTAFSKTFVSSEYIEKLLSIKEIDSEIYLKKLAITKEVRDKFFRDIQSLALINKSHTFVFRPHPFVELFDYKSCYCKVNGIKSLPTNVSIERNGSIQDDIASSERVITWYSSTAIDAYLMDKPVAIYDPVVTPEYMKIGFLKYFTTIKNSESLNNFLTESVSKKNKEADNYIFDIYGPIDGNSANRVAFVVQDIIKNHNEDFLSEVNWFNYCKVLLNMILIDTTKYLLKKVSLLHRIKPFYKGVLTDDKFDANIVENKENKNTDHQAIFRLEENGYSISERD